MPGVENHRPSSTHPPRAALAISVLGECLALLWPVWMDSNGQRHQMGWEEMITGEVTGPVPK